MDVSAVHRTVCGFCTYREIDRQSTKRRNRTTEVQRGTVTPRLLSRVTGLGTLLESGHEAVLPSMQQATNRKRSLTRARRTLTALAYNPGGSCC